MRYLKFIYLSLCLAFVSSCSDNEPVQTAENGNIKMRVSVGNLKDATRADDETDLKPEPVAKPFLGESLSSENPLDVALWFSINPDSYPQSEPGQTISLPMHTTATFTGPDYENVTYLGADNNQYPIQYPNDGSSVYCVGLYPRDNWTETVSDNKGISKVSHAINGEEDIMFARPVVGSWKSHFESIKFEHALTWIKIAACAVSADALNAWGNLKEISIQSAKTVEIDLHNNVNLVSGTDVSENLEDRYHYSSDGQWITTLNFKKDDNGEYIQTLPITSTMDEIASVFCSPAKEYTLHIVTENRTVETTVKLNWLSEDDTVTELQIPGRARGRCFVISLYFYPYNVVTAACTLDKWNVENDDIYFGKE